MPGRRAHRERMATRMVELLIEKFTSKDGFLGSIPSDDGFLEEEMDEAYNFELGMDEFGGGSYPEMEAQMYQMNQPGQFNNAPHEPIEMRGIEYEEMDFGDDDDVESL